MTKYNPKGWVKGDVLYTDEDVASLPKGTEWENLTQSPWSAIVVYVPPAPADDPAPTTHAVQLVEPTTDTGEVVCLLPGGVIGYDGHIQLSADDAFDHGRRLISAALAVKAASK